MSKAPSKRRMAENEVVFREYNERIKKGFDELKKIAEEDGQRSFISKDDAPLLFYCECSDENCLERVAIKPSRYNRIHEKRDRFVLIRGHETNSIEKIVATEDGFCVVEKHVTPPESASGFKKNDGNRSWSGT